MLLRPLTRAVATATCLAVLALSGCKQKTPKDKLEEVQGLLQERQIPLAVIKMKDLINEAPEDPATLEARMLLGQIYESQGQPENLKNALKEYAAVYSKVGLKNDMGAAAYQMATGVYARQNDFAGAIKHMEEGIELAKKQNPELVEEYQMILNSILLSDEDHAKQDTAVAFYNDKMLNSENPAIRGNARETLARYKRDQKKFAEANAVYSAYMEKYPDDKVNPQLLVAMALNDKQLGDDAKAEQRFADGAAKMKEQADGELNKEAKTRILSDLAQFQELMKKYDDAEATLRQIMALHVGTRPALDAQFAIAQMYQRAAQFDKAIAILEQIKKDNGAIPQLSENVDRGIAAIRKQATDAATSGTATAVTPAATPAATPATP